MFAEITQTVIELITEFYDQPRIFRIIGEGGEEEFVSFSNADMHTNPVRTLDGNVIEVDPVYDIQVSAQKSSPYSSMAQNELALQLYNAGIFDPQRADMALATIELMDFKDKDKIISKIKTNGTLYEMVTVLSERLAKAEAALGLGVSAQQGAGRTLTGDAKMPEQNNMGVVHEESGITAKARKESAESTQPR